MTDPGVKAPLRKDNNSTLPRVQNYISSERYRDVNLMSRVYPDVSPAVLSYWSVPDTTPGAWENYRFDDAITQDFTETKVGQSFGPTWTTHWFKVDLTIPAEWSGKHVRFRWDSGSEATLYDSDGKVLQGLSSTKTDQVRIDYVLGKTYDGPSAVTLYVEMAANRILSTTDGDLIDPPPDDMMFTLVRAECSRVDDMAYKLVRDLEVLSELAADMPNDCRGYSALFTANQMVNNIIAGDDQSASDLADAYFTKGNGARAHTLSAIGNCHIDTAWLWPYSETKRKVARSFSSQLVLMEEDPDYIFVASQAQQWAWLKEYYPELFERVKAKVVEGKFLPVGATWIEMDGNIPSGESFIRQFLHGQKFYQKELGVTCKEFWLPDTFGYSSQIPGMMKHMGLNRFLTQKMSWNFVNKFPHHNFIWEGIDGSQILAHFPPGDSYSMKCSVKEARYSESNLRDKGRVSTSAFLYGYGDGGGGPTRGMLERINRMTDTDGIPKMKKTTPDDLFSTLESEKQNLCKWTGELYLELHNGTYTSQAAMKEMCRKAEFQMRDTEFLLCMATVTTPDADLLASSLTELDVAWKKVLLNQFHDVLPGSGIEMVYSDASALYDEAIASAKTVWDNSLSSLYGAGERTDQAVFNTLQWGRKEVVGVPSDGDSTTYSLVSAPAFSASPLVDVVPTTPCTAEADGDNFVLSNGLVQVKVDPNGQILSLTLADSSERDVFVTTSGEQLLGNKILLFDDQPLYWDAWDVMDYHLETETSQNDGPSTTKVSITSQSDLRCSLSWGCAVGRSSTLTQEIILTAECPYVTFKTTVDWKENRKLLKVGFDTSVKSSFVSYDTQFGFLERPTAVNTSWDSARYEVCGHKWADISDPKFGFAVLNDSKYGWSGRDSSITLTLLKSPKAPDANCDMRTHTFSYAVMPHEGTHQEGSVMQRAYEFNNPLAYQLVPTGAVTTAQSWITVTGTGIVLHTVKPAEDGSGDVILRMFESNGTYSTATININKEAETVTECDGMEAAVAGGNVTFGADNRATNFTLSLPAFAIKAFRVSF